MSDEDNSQPMALHSEGWGSLPDGRQQLLIQCKTLVDYATMPKTLVFGETVLHRSGWDSEKKVAFFRSGGTEDLQGKAE